MNPIEQVRQLGQAMWSDYIRRGLLTSGEFKQLIAQGISGVTSNPTIFEKAIVGSADYDEALQKLAHTDKSTKEIYENLAIEDIQMAADQLRPIYDQTEGWHGYASLEVSPLLAGDSTGTVEEARWLFAALARPNVMVKVPATPEGILAMRHLISEGINVNVTLIFSLDSYRLVMEAYLAGIEDLLKGGGDASKIASVASFFLSRIDTAVDNQLDERIRQGETKLKSLLGKTAISSARMAYQLFKEVFYGERFTMLKAKGARVQRPLWASTGTKNPAYSDIIYVEPLIGADTINTMPLATINAFLEHGRAEPALEQNLTQAEQTLAALEEAGVSLKEVTSRLLADGIKSFSNSFEKLLSGIEEKKVRLLAAEHAHPGVSIDEYLGDVEAALARLDRQEVTRRIWRKDHTVWHQDPTEIANRLGWLTVTDIMSEQVTALISFVQEVKDDGFHHVVLLGMGGSSLGAEVLHQVFGGTGGYPELIVLDSTVPAWIQAVADAIDPARTLFLVSSKSGTTTEPLILFWYFHSLVERAAGKERAGRNFVAITDPGTPLVRLAEEEGFRQVFLNPADIGGRYSVLSYFGLVPAVLVGVDIETLLDRAEGMRESCASCVPTHENPGAWLGAYIGTLTLRGRDKLTLITSPAVEGFGLWVEQLIAESTGKEGKGIIPVAGEPLVEPSGYDDDRLFIYLRLGSDDNSAIDAAVEKIKASGQPVVVLGMRDKYDLGAEFYRWEFATAIAGAILGIHPFNQPDVQRAKDATEHLLKEYVATGHLPRQETAGTLADLLAETGKGKYLAIMAYLRQTPEIDGVFADLRRQVAERYHVATTLGYGPRFLHSTGQLHKGGPDSGLFLQLVTDHEEQIPVPGKPYTFGVVADAQALGDFEALKTLGRRVIRIHVEQGDPASISRLINEL